MIVEGGLLLERNLELEVERGMGTVNQGLSPSLDAVPKMFCGSQASLSEQ